MCLSKISLLSYVLDSRLRGNDTILPFSLLKKGGGKSSNQIEKRIEEYPENIHQVPV